MSKFDDITRMLAEQRKREEAGIRDEDDIEFVEYGPIDLDEEEEKEEPEYEKNYFDPIIIPQRRNPILEGAKAILSLFATSSRRDDEEPEDPYAGWSQDEIDRHEAYLEWILFDWPKPW